MAKVMVITGASRGIGAATARLAAARGYDVAVNYVRDKDAADAVVKDISAAGQRAIAIQGDVAEEADVVRLFETCDRELGELSVLINNAGIVKPQTTIDSMDAERINAVLKVNVTGSFLCAREAVRRMSTARGGSGGVILNVSSAAAKLGSPNEFIDYAASKGAIDTFTIGLAKEVATQGIRVNGVRPGLIDTEIHASCGEPNRTARLRSAIPMQREGSAEEVAEAILWLVCDESSYVTSTLVDVSGGR